MTSANVVGYNTVSLRAGSKIIGASFDLITQTGSKLTEFTPVGYLENTAFIGGQRPAGCAGAIVAQFLTKDGNIATDTNGYDKAYSWYHTYNAKGTNPGWQNDACWKQRQGTKWVAIDSTNAPEIDEGFALYIRIPTPANYCEGMAIQNAGQALLYPNTVPLRAGSKPICPTVSRTVKLSEVSVGGYLENPAFVGGQRPAGCQGAIVVQFLTKDGNVETDKSGYDKSYSWYHTYNAKGTNPGWQNDACWKQRQGTKWVAIDSTNAPEINAGEGVYVRIPTPANYCEGMQLEFPGVDDAPDAE